MNACTYISPSHYYIVQCYDSAENKYCFFKFELPLCDPLNRKSKYINNAEVAQWHFEYRLKDNDELIVKSCIVAEDFKDHIARW